ncbi:MAG: Gfo/Idh/MocA family oxidoreductase [Planctomycetes bacterium]|nr:Gfo/Idh/MocA family oxidoreductase [Planctomycetota bacterium]
MPRASNPDPGRRRFLKTSALLSASALASPVFAAGWHGRGEESIRVGLIGCGGRGTGAARNCLDADPAVKITAMGDLFADRLKTARQGLSAKGDRFAVTDDQCFVGFDAFENVLASGVDLVILATPPGFRPQHLAAAIAAGKHVFMEKPVAVDPVGIRSVIASSALAQDKKLAIVAGTQRRHEANYLETMRRIHDGAIGEIVAGECYWNQGFLWVHGRKGDYSDVEWQIRNWLYFAWLSGDHIVEQHIHNIDVMNWALGGPPKRVSGMGGRQVRTGAECGHIFDHFAIELEYDNGARIHSFCRQIDGTQGRVAERLVGTKGVSNPARWIKGDADYRFEGERSDPYVQEHADLIASIRAGAPLNEGRRVAESTLTAIMGRMAAYTGREIAFDWALNESQLSIVPADLDFGDLPVPEVAIPGITPLV